MAVENRKSIGIIKEKFEVIRCKILMLKIVIPALSFHQPPHHIVYRYTAHNKPICTFNIISHSSHLSHNFRHFYLDTHYSLSPSLSFPLPQHIKWQNPESTHVYAFGQDIYKYLISNHLNNSIIISANLYDHR